MLVKLMLKAKSTIEYIVLEKVFLRTSSASDVVVGVKALRWLTPSMKRNTPAEYPPINRLALAAIASNAGCTSSGELAITLRISAAAACCSRASFNSLPRPETDEMFRSNGGWRSAVLGLAGFAVLW